MKRLEYLQNAQALLARLVSEVNVANSGGHFDINKVAEDFYVPILSALFECNDLKNQNRDLANFPAVDLGSKKSRLSFQITSDRSSGKVVETLKKFREHNLQTQYDEVYILVITNKQKSYTSSALEAQIKALPIEFSPDKHIIDYSDISERISQSDTSTIKTISDILEGEFAREDSHKKFNRDLQSFLEIGRSKIAYEKKTKKYIPSVFVESCSTKDAVRLFANPLFFHRKIDDSIDRLRFDGFNELLDLAGIDRVEDRLEAAWTREQPESLEELSSKLKSQRAALSNFKEAISPFAWGGDKQNRYKPAASNKSEWQLFSYQIESSGSGIKSRIDDAIEEIDIAQAKIFLVTGMAGQGKTNFVCDLIENQFQKFEIPSIFIPARDLNYCPAPNRIFQFIVNNKYAPKVTSLHELLELFDLIATENQKPFVIAIDGINEVGALNEFNAELKIFLDALCQYESVKVLLTCRSEFFEQRFSTLLDEPFADKIYRVQDLKSNMSEASKERLLKAYFEHFSISLRLSESAANFLKDDLLLLRIFCEKNEGAQKEFVSEIYKGDLFEGYLQLRASTFSRDHQRNIVPTLYKIAKAMIEAEEFSNISLQQFEQSEIEIIDQLIADDIVLRREVPEPGLSSIGAENISFTYDELRDYIIAEYVVSELSNSSIEEVRSLFERLPNLTIREGLFRYVYILSRMRSNVCAIQVCEESKDFLSQYALNLHMIQPSVQNSSDADKVRQLLQLPQHKKQLADVVFFLFGRRDETHVLSVKILVDHINSLTDSECEMFMKAAFSHPHDYERERWRERIGRFIEPVVDFSDEKIAGINEFVLAFALQVSGFADWETCEKFKNRMEQYIRSGLEHNSFKHLAATTSPTIAHLVAEVHLSKGSM